MVKAIAVTTEARRTTQHRAASARWWFIGAIQGGSLLVLLGASWLFSFIRDVSWVVCSMLSLCLGLLVMLLLRALLRDGR